MGFVIEARAGTRVVARSMGGGRSTAASCSCMVRQADTHQARVPSTAINLSTVNN